MTSFFVDQHLPQQNREEESSSSESSDSSEDSQDQSQLGQAETAEETETSAAPPQNVTVTKGPTKGKGRGKSKSHANCYVAGCQQPRSGYRDLSCAKHKRAMTAMRAQARRCADQQVLDHLEEMLSDPDQAARATH